MSKILLNELSGPPDTPQAGKAAIFVDQNGDPAVRKSSGLIELFKSLFGSSLRSQKETTSATNTDTSFDVYDTLDVSDFNFSSLIFIRYVWGYSAASQDIRVQIYKISGGVKTPLITEHRQEPKDGGSNQRYHFLTFTLEDLSGVDELQIEFASSVAGNTATIFESEFLLFRTS